MKAPQLLEYGSLLSYCPRSTSQAGKFSKWLMQAIKNESPLKVELLSGWAVGISGHYILPSELIATLVHQNLQKLPFAHFFGRDVTLVPVPRASLMQKDSLWPSLNIARTLEKRGLGSVSLCSRGLDLSEGPLWSPLTGDQILWSITNPCRWRKCLWHLHRLC